jgi:hypothetical protein
VDADRGGDVDFGEFIEWWENDAQNARLKKKLRGASSVATVRGQGSSFPSKIVYRHGAHSVITSNHRRITSVYDQALGLIGTALSKKISVFEPSSLKVVPISPNAS